MTVEAGNLILDPSVSDDEMMKASVSAGGYPACRRCTRHHDDREDQAVLVVQRRGRHAALDNPIRYESFSTDVCRSCARTP